MTRSTCFVCGEEVRRQLGFNPSALTIRNKKILKSLRSSWTKSLCILLDVTEGESRTLLQTVPYCLSCHELISNVDFMITTIARLERKIDSVKGRVKDLLRRSYKVSPKHRQLLSQILSPNPKETKKPKEEPPELSESPVINFDPQNVFYDVSGMAQEDPEFVLISNFTEDHDNKLFDAAGEYREMNDDDNEDPLWKPELDRTRNSVTIHPDSSKPRNRTQTPQAVFDGNSCPICGKFILGKVERKQHMKQLHPPVPYETHRCQFCGKLFNFSEELEGHEVLHAPTNGNPFSCVLCPAEMTSVYDLQKHVLREHETQQVFKCDQCEQTLSSAMKLRLHKKRAHLIGVDKNRMHQCPQCPFQALFPSVLKAHLRTHGERSFKCEIDNCSKMFYRKSTMNCHQRRIHGTGTKSFPCSLCFRTFATPSLVKAHQIHHSTVRPFMCELCSATFKSRLNLATHRKVHEKVSGTNIKLQKPRKARLTDLRLQTTHKSADSDSY